MPQPSPAGCRVFRGTQHETLHHEPSTEAERVPFLTQDQPFIAGSDLENGASLDPSAVRSDTDKSPIITVSSFPASDTTDDDHISSPVPSRWRWKERIPLLSAWVGRGYLSRHKKRPSEKPLSRHPLRRVLRLLAYSLMLL